MVNLSIWRLYFLEFNIFKTDFSVYSSHPACSPFFYSLFPNFLVSPWLISLLWSLVSKYVTLFSIGPEKYFDLKKFLLLLLLFVILISAKWYHWTMYPGQNIESSQISPIAPSPSFSSIPLCLEWSSFLSLPVSFSVDSSHSGRHNLQWISIASQSYWDLDACALI